MPNNFGCRVFAKHDLAFRGHRDDKVNFSNEDTNWGNFVATLQLMAKTDPILNEHLQSAKRNAKYTSKPLKIKLHTFMHQKLDKRSIRENALPYTVIADEATDLFSNHEILTVCLRFVDLSVAANPQVRECLLSFIHLQRANAEGISILKLSLIF